MEICRYSHALFGGGVLVGLGGGCDGGVDDLGGWGGSCVECSLAKTVGTLAQHNVPRVFHPCVCWDSKSH